MKLLLGLAVTLALLSPFLLAAAETVDEQIAEAVLPLPKELRAGATVVTFDPATGARKVLRQGNNSIVCQPKGATDEFIRCYHNSIAPRHELEAKLRAEKKTPQEIREAMAAAIKEGTLKPPMPGAMSYRLSNKDGVIKRLWIVSVPYATPESLGISTTSQRDAALKGHGLPWMMLPGTAGAHIMIPLSEDEY
jgi:hypothetical protein